MRSNYKLILFAIITILPLSWHSCSQKPKAESPFFFIQMTDIQFGMHENNLGYEQETFLYEKAVVEVNRLKPDFVVITGDLVHDPNDQDQINEFKRITNTIDPGIPVYLIPGNHDVGQVPDDESMDKYHRYYGEDTFAFHHKGSQFIGINTSLIKGEVSGMEQKQYEWLTDELAQRKTANHVIVFGHYPFFIQAFDEPERYSNIKPEHRDKYLSMFKENQVSAIFSGHLHNNAQADYEGIQLVSTSAVGKPLANAPSGFRIIKVFPDRIEHDYVGLDEVPVEVLLD